MQRRFFAILLGIALSAAGYAYGDKAPKSHDAKGHPHLTYEGQEGPDHWGALDPSYAACKTGTAQTPVDIAAAKNVPGLYPHFKASYKPSALHIWNNGHTIQANYDAGSELEVDQVKYALAQFHFHAHSEHTVDGKSWPLELHLVHKSAAGKLAVVGVFIREGAENAALKAVFANLPKAKAEATADVAGATVDAAKLLPPNLWMWRYDGSLTTPPCSEQVKWHVMAEAIEASKDQIAQFTALFPSNFRPVQPLGNRALSGAHFEYEGEEGPDHWGELAPTWNLCAAGKQQSPVEIPAGVTAAALAGLKVDYKPSALTIGNNGHTVQVSYDAGSKVTIGGKDFDLLQFHFHAHSEHTLAGKPAYPAELHLVHKSADGKLAVLGVFIAEGKENAALAKVFANLPAKAGPPILVADAKVEAAKILPANLAMWRYDGSLTTPPCSEGVKWHVFKNPVEASKQQIDAFKRLFENDARPVQKLNDRNVVGG